jgi:hypothetical protein
MTEATTMTIGDLRRIIKDLPDDMPLYLESGDYPEYFECLSIKTKNLDNPIEELISFGKNVSYGGGDGEKGEKFDALCFDFT